MHPSGPGTSHLAAYSPARPCRLRAVVLLPATLEPVLVLLADGQDGDYSLFHSTVSSTFCAFGRNSSNSPADAVPTSITTVLPSTSTMMNRSFESAEEPILE